VNTVSDQHRFSNDQFISRDASFSRDAKASVGRDSFSRDVDFSRASPLSRTPVSGDTSLSRPSSSSYEESATETTRPGSTHGNSTTSIMNRGNTSNVSTDVHQHTSKTYFDENDDDEEDDDGDRVDNLRSPQYEFTSSTRDIYDSSILITHDKGSSKSETTDFWEGVLSEDDRKDFDKYMQSDVKRNYLNESSDEKSYKRITDDYKTMYDDDESLTNSMVSDVNAGVDAASIMSAFTTSTTHTPTEIKENIHVFIRDDELGLVMKVQRGNEPTNTIVRSCSSSPSSSSMITDSDIGGSSLVRDAINAKEYLALDSDDEVIIICGMR
jgi:hypothetical protein